MCEDYNPQNQKLSRNIALDSFREMQLFPLFVMTLHGTKKLIKTRSSSKIIAKLEFLAEKDRKTTKDDFVDMPALFRKSLFCT